MPGEAEETRGRTLAGVELPAHELGDLADVGVDDHRPVQLDLDPRTFDRDLLEVPLAHRTQIAAPGGDSFAQKLSSAQ